MMKELQKKEPPPISKMCPACKVPFVFPPTERFFQCAPKKVPIPYYIYKCPGCLEQYSNLERLQPSQDKSFEDLTNEIRMGIWVCVPPAQESMTYCRPSHWKLHARGKLWTRCSHPDCQALFLFTKGKKGYRTLERHRLAMMLHDARKNGVCPEVPDTTTGDHPTTAAPATAGTNVKKEVIDITEDTQTTKAVPDTTGVQTAPATTNVPATKSATAPAAATASPTASASSASNVVAWPAPGGENKAIKQVQL